MIITSQILPLNFTVNENYFHVLREDLIPCFLGGNKVRIMAQYFRDMYEKEKNCMIVYGSRASNLCRVAALMCAERRIPCSVVYGEDPGQDYTPGINEIIVKSLNARLYYCQKCNVEPMVKTAFNDAIHSGLRPYYVFGNFKGEGNEEVGLRAYKDVIREISAFENDTGVHFDHIYIASGTGLTQGGLICGAIENKVNYQITGISIARSKTVQESLLKKMLHKVLSGQYSDASEIDCRIDVDDSALQGGYGRITDANKLFLVDLLKTDALPLDYCYTGKAFWGMYNNILKHNICRKNILFIHTGGNPLFFENVMESYQR